MSAKVKIEVWVIFHRPGEAQVASMYTDGVFIEPGTVDDIDRHALQEEVIAGMLTHPEIARRGYSRANAFIKESKITTL